MIRSEGRRLQLEHLPQQSGGAGEVTGTRCVGDGGGEGM